MEANIEAGFEETADKNFYLKMLLRSIRFQRTLRSRSGGSLMGGWRMKFILLLMVYFAGFATAIYCLAPPAENQIQAVSAIKSNEFAKSFNTGMHKCIDFSKDTAQRAGKVIRQKLDERRLQAGE